MKKNYDTWETTPHLWYNFCICVRYPLSLILSLYNHTQFTGAASQIILLIGDILLLSGEIFLCKKKRVGIYSILLYYLYCVLFNLFMILLNPYEGVVFDLLPTLLASLVFLIAEGIYYYHRFPFFSALENTRYPLNYTGGRASSSGKLITSTYGYSAQNPICIGHNQSLETYFSRLTDTNNRTFSWTFEGPVIFNKALGGDMPEISKCAVHFSDNSCITLFIKHTDHETPYAPKGFAFIDRLSEDGFSTYNNSTASTGFAEKRKDAKKERNLLLPAIIIIGVLFIISLTFNMISLNSINGLQRNAVSLEEEKRGLEQDNSFLKSQVNELKDTCSDLRASSNERKALIEAMESVDNIDEYGSFQSKVIPMKEDGWCIFTVYYSYPGEVWIHSEDGYAVDSFDEVDDGKYVVMLSGLEKGIYNLSINSSSYNPNKGINTVVWVY